jgi:hypothetical protein
VRAKRARSFGMTKLLRVSIDLNGCDRRKNESASFSSNRVR